MKLIAQVKLQPSEQQADALRRTLVAANHAANIVSDIAWETKQFRQFDLHHASYYAIREQFGLSAQAAVRVIAKVADAYKLDRKAKRIFKALGAIAYDARILRWFVQDRQVSIWTIDGRVRLSFVCGDRQAALLQGQRGESDLVCRDGKFYLLAVCEEEEPAAAEVDDYVGVDMGIANIAVDSDRAVYQGKTLRQVRYRHRKLRTKLQAKGTHAARRRLRKLSGKERRFATWVNHNISRRIVEKAKDTQRGIALEDLGGIRDGVTVRKAQRSTLHSWSFYQLRSFIEYKAKRTGVPVVAIDPRNTSRTCPRCGCIDKANRRTQETFLCIDCGYSGLADYVASVNIRRRAVVNPPNVPTIDIESRP
jgi:putative transposase